VLFQPNLLRLGVFGKPDASPPILPSGSPLATAQWKARFASGFSYGFRPKRSQLDALDALMVGIAGTKVNFILDADIRSFFNEVSQDWLVRFVEHRIGDKRIVRLIQKWLKAGVLEDGEKVVSEKGTPQGSVISPLLANVYLHYVFDLWADRWRRRKATGNMVMVRYADTAAFTVGTLISERPPHRTGRARFGHPAPTLGV
jgi:retron-type reverse transcriptase